MTLLAFPSLPKQRVYVAGPMRGYPKFNFDMFDLAKQQLEEKGYAVISPADLDRADGFGDDAWESVCWDYSRAAEIGWDVNATIRRDVNAILDCDRVVLLPGYERSTGAQAEIAVAQWAGVPCSTLNDFLTNAV